MVAEGGSILEYDPELTPRLKAETARIIREFSFAGAHVIIVGGLVPSLLVPRPDDGFERHVGTQDLDLCLGLALAQGKVGNYDRLEESLKAAGFSMARERGQPLSWRWRGGADVPLTVEFFCAADEGREPGRLYRPGGVIGGRLSAMVLAAGRLIDVDSREVQLEVALPSGGGMTRQPVKVAGPAAFLAAKADALRRRNKNKDAYDIVWLAESWPGGQGALAAEIKASRVFDSAEFLASLDALRSEFSTIDSAGAVKFARFMTGDARERDRFARQAVGAIEELMRLLSP